MLSLRTSAGSGGHALPAQTAAGPVTLRYIEGSSRKVTQLLGDFDKERRQPTLSQTMTRFGIEGSDLGYSFDHGGRAYFLFGDTVGPPSNVRDTIATTDVRDPESGVRLDFLTTGAAASATPLAIRIPGLRMGAFEVPVSGISLNNQIYIVVSTNHSNDQSSDRSVLTRFTPPSTFEPLRTISALPAGHFVKMSTHLQPQHEIAGLPPGGPFVFIWGTGKYRGSDAYFSVVPVSNFEQGDRTRYYAGVDGASPRWSEREADAVPIVRSGVMGDVSVTWCPDPGVWLMTYDSRPPQRRGIEFSYSSTPWGPWSEPQLIFDGERDGALGMFIHNPRARPPDNLAGPVIGPGTSNPDGVRGATYAPYVVERWTRRSGSELTIYYVLSTWNPYVVVLMKTRLQIA